MALEAVPILGSALVGAAIAWSLAAPPGPANAMMAQDAARRGFGAGVATGMGAVTGDLLMFLLMWKGVLAVVGGSPWALVGLAALGAALLAWFARDAYRAARAPLAAATGRGSFGKTFFAVLSSPFNWGWWLTVGTTLFTRSGISAFLGFFAGLVAWVLIWNALARAGASRFRRFTEFVGYASAGVLALFAGVLLIDAGRRLAELL